MLLKTIKNYYCPKIETSVHIQFCTQLEYLSGKESDIVEHLINPDCERKDQCDIARQQDGQTVYNWSCCVNPHLRTAV